MQKLRWIDILHMVGSVASVTGISLLWLRSQLTIETVVIDIPIIALLVLFSLGIGSVGIIVIRSGYCYFFKTSDILLKFAYFAISIPILSSILAGGLYFVWYLSLEQIHMMKG